MSRSYRKTPISANVNCHSERADKVIWHQRLRACQRTELASTPTEALDAYLPLDRRQVSNVWNMGKDGKHYFPKHRQIALAKEMANRKGCNPQERTVLKKRLLHKWMGK